MDQYSPSWSRTQRDLFLKCPSAWAMRYAVDRYSSQSSKPAQAPDWHVMLRALKSTIVDRLEALRAGTEWSESIASFVLSEHLRDGFKAQKRALSAVKHQALHLFAEHRLKLLWRTDTIVDIHKGTIRQWSLLDRRNSEHINGYDLYASPDLAYRSGRHWHLVRLDMQGLPLSEGERLETLAMVVWAVQRDGLPQVNEQFHVHTIGWRKGSWVTRSMAVSSEGVEAAKSLIAQDVSAMKRCAEVSKYAFECLPLAAEETTCISCSYRVGCLAGYSLKEKKNHRLSMLQQTD